MATIAALPAPPQPRVAALEAAAVLLYAAELAAGEAADRLRECGLAMIWHAAASERRTLRRDPFGRVVIFGKDVPP